MPLSHPRRLLAIVITALALVVPLTITAEAGGRHHGSVRHHHSWPDRIELPNGFQPEGITIGPGPVAFFGSRLDGDIYAADLRSGRGKIISQGPGTASVGLKSDQRGLLYVAGGTAGTGRVVDVRSGRVLASYQFATGPTFVNDVVLAGGYAWFTDSRQPDLYRVPLAKRGRPAPASAVTKIAIGRDWVQDFTPGTNNANGIVASPDGRAVLVVQSNTGFLFRIDPRTGRATRVDLGGRLLTNGDGLLLKGRTLYVVQNRLNTVTVFSLNRSGTAGRYQRAITDADFDVPTTVAAYGKSLYLPNARFSTPATPTTPYWVTRVSAGKHRS